MAEDIKEEGINMIKIELIYETKIKGYNKAFYIGIKLEFEAINRAQMIKKYIHKCLKYLLND